jgi:hypothetical protein
LTENIKGIKKSKDCKIKVRFGLTRLRKVVLRRAIDGVTKNTYE